MPNQRTRPHDSALADYLRESQGPILVLTGAGISVASGLPTFRGRDPGAVWAQDITDVATERYFRRKPVASWAWYRQRFEGLRSARPNDAHRALKTLEEWQDRRNKEFLLVTQNIDTLHEQAGSKEVVKVHGSSDRARCSDPACPAWATPIPMNSLDFKDFDRKPTSGNIPRCALCGAIMRPHILWFDEYYEGHDSYQIARVQQAAQRLALLLCIGTSFSVGITSFLSDAARLAGAPILVVDPRPIGDPGLIQWTREAETLLPIAVESLVTEP